VQLCGAADVEVQRSLWDTSHLKKAMCREFGQIDRLTGWAPLLIGVPARYLTSAAARGVAISEVSKARRRSPARPVASRLRSTQASAATTFEATVNYPARLSTSKPMSVSTSWSSTRT